MAEQVADVTNLPFDLPDQRALRRLVPGGDGTRSQGLCEIGDSSSRVFAAAELLISFSLDIKGMEVVFKRLAPDFMGALKILLCEKNLEKIGTVAPSVFP